MLTNKFLRIITGLLLIIGLTVGCALGPPTYQQNVQSSVNRGIVRVDVRGDGTVILNGWVENLHSKYLAESEARRGEGVTKVINRLRVRF